MNRIFLGDLLRTISERGRHLLGSLREGPSPDEGLTSLANTVLSNKGEASGIVMASDFFRLFHSASDNEKEQFFMDLALEFGPNEARLEMAVMAYQKDRSPAASLELHAASEPRRQELFRRLNLAPGGTAGLVNMRAGLLMLLKDRPELGAVDGDLVHLFASWFNRGFLVIKKVDWDTSATILEKIIQYEAVHAIHNWQELRRRINPVDRCCYAFFHPALLDEPLIFVEVALSDNMVGAIAPILSSERRIMSPEATNTAIFYSISNCQKGLAGISFGHFLIKQVVEELKQEYPTLKKYVTLSPVPGFMRWFEQTRGGDHGADIDLQAILQNDAWWTSKERALGIKDRLMPIVADYLVNGKANGFPLDPVARFHLGNGASLERINWLGDTSPKGMSQSAGVMVNYLYNLDKIQENHERYATSGHVAVSGSARKRFTT